MFKPVATLALTLAFVAAVPAAAESDGWIEGTPELESIGELAFGPDDVLFIADPIGSTIYAIKTRPKTAVVEASFLIEAPDVKIASMLGTSASAVLINDMAVHPTNGDVYLSVSRGRGEGAQPVLVLVNAVGKFEVVSLENITYAKKTLGSPPEDDPAARRNPRTMSITDLVFTDGRLYVAGLSNEEFASRLRNYAFPFDADDDDETAVEIYHGNHGTYETHAPVRTFLPYEIDGAPHLVAAYTCTPLVTFPLEELQSSVKVRGKTVAELGGGNAPLDMIAYEKDGEEYILISNSRHGVMKVRASGIGAATSITEPTNGAYGVGYETVEDLDGVLQMALAGDGTIVVLIQERSSNSMMLANIEAP